MAEGHDPGEGGPAPSSGGAPGRILGLDLGQARIGVAVSDPERRMAVPVGTVRTGPPHDVRALAALARDHGVTRLVIGLPLSMSGERGEAATRAETFAAMLRQALGLPVDLQDERLTTVEAERALAASGVRGRARRQVIDRSAATIILQAYLDRTR